MMTFEKTNNCGMINFLEELNETVKRLKVRGPITLVIDNHKSHYVQHVKSYYSRFSLLQLPRYSSNLSPVETVWSLLKAEVSKQIDRMPRELT